MCSVTSDGRIRLESADGFCRIVIDNPKKANCLTISMLEALRAAWSEADADPTVRAIVLAAEGDRHFSSGADVNAFRFEGSAEDQTAAMVMTSRQCRVRKPVVAAVTGLVVGGALGLVADCDVVLASQNAAFADPHVRHGQVCGYGAWRLAERIQVSEVVRLTLADCPLAAARAFQLGLVSELHQTPDEARVAADALAHRISTQSPTAVMGNVALMRKLVGGPSFDAVVAEAQATMRTGWNDRGTATALHQWSTSQGPGPESENGS
jgi:enoyl-CoA hydratase/carnithine racemase